MKDDQHYIDKIFGEALTDYKELPNESAWEGIAAGVVAPSTVVTKAVLFKKYMGILLVSTYLLVGPLFYSDLFFDDKKETSLVGVEANDVPLPNGLLKNNEVERGVQSTLSEQASQNGAITPADGQANGSAMSMTDRTMNALSGVKPDRPLASAINDNQGNSFLSFDHSEQELKQEETVVQQPYARQHVEVENVVEALPIQAYAYRTFLAPVLENAVPIDSVNEYEYYEKTWKWFGTSYVMPVYWSGSGLARAQVGVDIGRYLGPRSSIQIGLRYQFASGDPHSGDIDVMTIPIQYRRYFGQSKFKWFLGAGAVVIPGASPGRPFDRSFYSSSLIDMELSGGMIYHPSTKMRLFLSPTWQQPFSSDNGVSVQLGLQFRF